MAITTVEVDWQPSEDPLGNEALQFVTEHSHEYRKVTGCVWLPTENLDNNALVAFMHGASGSRFQAPIPYCAHKLAARGIASLALDGPVHGLRRKLDGGRIALYAEMAKPKAFEHLFRDWELAIHLAEQRLQISTEKFAYFGLSMGTFFGVPYLAHRSLNGQSTQAAVLGILGTTGVVSPFRRRLVQDAENIQVPLLFFMQQDDQLFKHEGCLEMFRTFTSQDKEIRENPGKHAEVPISEFDYAIDFLAQKL